MCSIPGEVPLHPSVDCFPQPQWKELKGVGTLKSKAKKKTGSPWRIGLTISARVGEKGEGSKQRKVQRVCRIRLAMSAWVTEGGGGEGEKKRKRRALLAGGTTMLQKPSITLLVLMLQARRRTICFLSPPVEQADELGEGWEFRKLTL